MGININSNFFISIPYFFLYFFKESFGSIRIETIFRFISNNMQHFWSF
ncbi:hypothetical protein B4092_4894 [Bacillus licheniformis]|nr:hypothetical protein B4092_4894 [Bacillus licheniformis]